MNEVKDDMKLMNENMKWHEVGGLKVENVGGMKMWKRENPDKNSRNSIILHHIIVLLHWKLSSMSGQTGGDKRLHHS